MSADKFTPGPWTACFSSYNKINNGFHITASPHGSVRPIVRCTWSLSDGEAETENLTANAHLIAAAPCMAEYIKRKADSGDEEAAILWRRANGSS